MSQKDALEVIVQGGPVEVNALVYGVVQHALSEAGFTEVSVHSPQGDVEANVSEIPSLLDVIRADRPALFDTPIKVKQLAHSDDVLGMPEDPDSFDIARVVYTPLGGAVTSETTGDATVEDAPF